MGTSKKRKNHKAKIDNRNHQAKMAIRRQFKEFENFEIREREIKTERYAKMAESTMPIDPVTKQILSPRDAIISSLAENYRTNNGKSSSAMLMTNIYEKS